MKSNASDMTQGKIFPLMLQFAVPVMLGSLFQNFYNLADMSIAGYTLGDHALAAISASAALVNLINAMSIGFNTGNSILISQAFGAKDTAYARRCFAGVVELCLALIISLTAVLLLFMDPLLRLVKTPEALFADAREYVAVLFLGFFASMLYNMIAGVFRALGNSRVPLLFLICSSLLNIGLDLLFLVPLQMGVRGAALATVLAQGLSALFSWIYFYTHYPEMRLHLEDFRGNRSLLAEMLPMGISVAISQSLFAIGDIAVQGAVNALGEKAIVAQAAASKIKSICMLPSAGMGSTCAIFSAQNYGAGKPERTTKVLQIAVYFSMACNLVSYAVIFFFGGRLVQLVTNTSDTEVIANGTLLLRIVVAFIFAQTIVMSYRMSIQGMRRKMIPILGTGIELVTRFFCALVLAPRLGFLGICFAEPLSWVVSGCVMVLCYFLVLRKERQKAPPETPASSSRSHSETAFE